MVLWDCWGNRTLSLQPFFVTHSSRLFKFVRFWLHSSANFDFYCTFDCQLLSCFGSSPRTRLESAELGTFPLLCLSFSFLSTAFSLFLCFDCGSV